MTDSYLFGEFLSHIPCWLLFTWGVSRTHPMLASLCGEFLLHIPCWLLYVEVFFTCPMLACSCWEFILHILRWLLYVGSFYYTSCAWCFRREKRFLFLWEYLL